MPTASGTRVVLAYVEETTRGTTPSTPTLKTLRSTSRNVNLEKEKLETAEVRASRQKKGSRRGFNTVVGAPGYELSRAAYDDFIRYAMGSTWVTVAVTSSPDLGITSATPGTGFAQFDRSAGSFITDGFRPGDIIDTTSFAAGANNTRWRVVTVAALTMDVIDTAAVAVTAAGSAGPTITYPGRRMDIGTTLLTVTLERQFQDITQYQAFLGVAVNEWALSVQPRAIVGGTFNLTGMSASAMAGSSVSSSAPTAAPANTPYAAFDGVMYENALVIAIATAFDMTLNNNRKLEAVIGSKFSPDVYEGQAVVGGTTTFFLEDAVLFNKFDNETVSSTWLKLDDANGTDFFSIVVPNQIYDTAGMDPPPEGPVPLEMAWSGEEVTLSSPGGTTTDTSLTIQVSHVPS